VNQKDLTLAVAKKFFLTQVESIEIIKFILANITQGLKTDKDSTFAASAPSPKRRDLPKKSAIQKQARS